MNQTSTYALYQASFKEGKLFEFVILCLDPPDEPDWHLPMDHVTSVETVVEMLKQGDRVWAQWGQVSIPVELVRLPNGEEALEVVQRGQPLGFRSLADLPCYEASFCE